MFTLLTMADTRDRILGCACDLYMQDGLEGFSMRKLARSVGVTAPALYRHFENREEVLLEVVGEAYDELFQTLSSSLSGTTPMERFLMSGEAYMDFALSHPRYFQIMHAFAEFMGLDDPPAALAKRSCALEQFWYDRVRECQDAGMLREDDIERISLTLWAHAYGLLSLYLRRLMVMSEEIFREEFRASFLRVLRGLATEEAGTLLEEEGPDESAGRVDRSVGGQRAETRNGAGDT
jgi:AcrR family transcriptional regulator